jgi:hypothetical protein
VVWSLPLTAGSGGPTSISCTAPHLLASVRSWHTVVGASLQGIAASIRVLELPGLATKGDVRDWLAAGGTREQLDALVEQAPDWQPPPEAPPDTNRHADKDKAAGEQDLIDELARLNPVDYDRRRDGAADQMGVRRNTLDDEVEARRHELAEEAGPPPLFGHWVVEPWPEAVDTGALILALIGRVKRHVILSDDEALAVALWILFAWVHETAAVHSPILLVTSAEANSGKTTLISVVSFLVPRGLMTTGISEAALFRSIEKWLRRSSPTRPTFCWLTTIRCARSPISVGHAAPVSCDVSATTAHRIPSQRFARKSSA